jgi:hypothetical protein
MADLITLAELRALRGDKPTNTLNDDKLSALIPAASAIVLAYTERDFGTTPPAVAERSFEYDNSGYLDIDDAVSITSVVITVPWGADYTMTTDEWLALPARRDDSPVYWYLSIPGWVFGASPEMGFARNADVAYAEGRWRTKPSTVKVTASWGWPAVPPDVKLATKWIIDDWAARPSGEGLTSESIESYARSWGGRSGEALALAIPNRARDILAAYQKVHV